MFTVDLIHKCYRRGTPRDELVSLSREENQRIYLSLSTCHSSVWGKTELKRFQVPHETAAPGEPGQNSPRECFWFGLNTFSCFVGVVYGHCYVWAATIRYIGIILTLMTLMRVYVAGGTVCAMLTESKYRVNLVRMLKKMFQKHVSPVVL